MLKYVIITIGIIKEYSKKVILIILLTVSQMGWTQPSIMKRFKVLFIPLLGISISESSRDFANGRQDCTAGEQINDPKHTHIHIHALAKSRNTPTLVSFRLHMWPVARSEYEVYWCFTHVTCVTVTCTDTPVYCTAGQESHQSDMKHDQQDQLQEAAIAWIKDSMEVCRDFLN